MALVFEEILSQLIKAAKLRTSGAVMERSPATVRTALVYRRFKQMVMVFPPITNQLIEKSMKAAKLLLAVMVIASVHAQKSSPDLPSIPPLSNWVASAPMLSSQLQAFYNFYEKTDGGATLSEEQRKEVIAALTDIIENFKDELPKTTVGHLIIIRSDLIAFETKHDGITHINQAMLEILNHHHVIASNGLRRENFTDIGPFLFNVINKSYILKIMIHMKADLLRDFLGNELAFETEEFWQQRREDLFFLIDLENDVIKEIEVVNQEMLAAIYSRDELKDNYEFYREQYDKMGGVATTLKKKNANMVRFLNRLKWQKPPLRIKVK